MIITLLYVFAAALAIRGGWLLAPFIVKVFSVTVELIAFFVLGIVAIVITGSEKLLYWLFCFGEWAYRLGRRQS